MASWHKAVLAALSMTAVACGGAPKSVCAPVQHKGATKNLASAEICRDPKAKLEVGRVELEGGVLLVEFDPADFEVGREVIWKWITDAAQGVTLFYGRFPVRECVLKIVPRFGSGVMFGQASSVPRLAVSILVGRQSTAADFVEDWTLTHELAHLAFPNMSSRHRWIEEGLATYVEPVIRYKMGLRTERSVWSEWYQSMHQGQPEEGDRGLDFTPTWGRVYWGGALFSLVADVEIRRQSQNRFGLRDALRGIVDSGGTMATSWKIEDAFKIGDRTTNTNVLMDEYRKRRADPAPVKMEELWANLGVSFENGRVKLDDAAPWVHIRRGILRD